MAKQIKSRRISQARKNTFQVRELWLAAIGAVSLGRKQGVKLYATLLQEGRGLQDRVNGAITDLGEQFTAAIDLARERTEAFVTPLVDRAQTSFATVRGEVESRLQPVLVRFGVAKAPAKRRATAKRPTRKPAAKRAAKRAPRKAA